MKNTVLTLTLFIASFPVTAQKLLPGFNIQEYKELFILSVKNYYPGESNDIPYPSDFKVAYQSQPMGLDNKWELWVTPDKVAAISIRGTSEKPESMLANYYAAMVPASGELTLSENDIFKYKLSENPKAAVHVGWLISMAFLSMDIIPKIDSCYKNGIKNFYITGHSQGGAICFLLTAYFNHLQKQGTIYPDIRFKTYCSAGPKPGNQYFAYDYSLLTQSGWGYNIVNADDWVPETLLTVQKTDDLNDINLISSLKQSIKQQSFFKRLIMQHLYNKIDKPSRKAQKRYQKYFGQLVSKSIKAQLPGFIAPEYYPSSNYVQAGNTYVMQGDKNYYEIFPHDKTKLMQYHQPYAYYYLINELSQ